MAQIREIKKRIGAVGNIQRITKTMQMIATAKFTASLQRSQATKPFNETLRDLVGKVSMAAGDIEHPLLATPATPLRRELLLYISSDRGLCGAYNGNVFRNALAHYRDLDSRGIEMDLEVSGKKAIGFFKFAGIELANQYTIGDKPAYAEVERLATTYMDKYIAGEYDAIRVAYMRYESNARQIPEVMRLLPMQSDAIGQSETAGAEANYDFSPSGEKLLGDLLPLAVKSQLFQCFNDAVVSEQIMRMIAMKAATENAKDLSKTLKRDFNRARQAQITTELSEIISGSTALE